MMLRGKTVAAAMVALMTICALPRHATTDIGRDITRGAPPPPSKPGEATFRGGYARTGEGRGKLPAKPRVLWSAAAGKEMGTPGQAVMALDWVFSGAGERDESHSAGVYAFDAASGKLRWFHATAASVWTSPTYEDGTVYAGSYDHRLYALNARDGTERWTYETDDIIEGAVCVMKGTVYVGSADGNLHAVDAATGKLRWKYDVGAPVMTSPACVGGTIYVTAAKDGRAFVVALKRDGKDKKRERWRFDLDGEDVTNGVAVRGPLVVVADSAGTVYFLSH